jgi:hypothetical protein
MDQLLIDVATKAVIYEQSSPWIEDPSISDFQLASFRALLASFLSNHHERPLYFEGLELFSRGMLLDILWFTDCRFSQGDIPMENCSS